MNTNTNESKYKFKSIKLIAETFEKYKAKFHVLDIGADEVLEADFPIKGGTNVVMRFYTRDDDNDIAARILGLVTRVPDDRRIAIIKACNELNYKVRFIKFVVDSDGDINVEYDFPIQSSDECIGEMAFEVFVRTMQILNNGEYLVLMQALYGSTNEDIATDNQSLHH